MDSLLMFRHLLLRENEQMKFAEGSNFGKHDAIFTF